jgi:hypothetical protein
MLSLPLWRDLAIVLLSIELLIALIPILVIFYFGVTYVPRGITWIRDFLRKVQVVTYDVQHRTLKVARSVISPFIAVRRLFATGEGMIRGMFSIMRAR